MSDEGVLVPDRGRDYPAFTAKDTLQEDDLLALGLVPQELPIDHGDGVVEVQVVYVWPDEPEVILGLDDIRNYTSLQAEVEEPQDEEEAEKVAKAILSRPSVGVAVSTIDIMKKSFYGYDVSTPDGMMKILDALPIMDVDYVKQLALEIWPDAQAEDSDPDLLRSEVRGYLLDQLGDINGLD
jgi:hypothetical protein